RVLGVWIGIATKDRGSRCSPGSTGVRAAAAEEASAALHHVLVGLFAFGADRKPLRVPVGDPHLAAQSDHRTTGDSALGDLLLLHVVGETLAIPIVVRDIRFGLTVGEDLVEDLHGHRASHTFLVVPSTV